MWVGPRPRGAGRRVGWGLCMLGSARGRRAIARGAQIAAFAASAMMAFSVMPAAEPAVNGRVGSGAGAGTIEGALILAYHNNPQLNAQRAAARATDENVPTALAGYRPRVTGTSSLTEQYLDNLHEVGDHPRRSRALYSIPRQRRRVLLRTDHDPDAVQRLPDRQTARGRRKARCSPRANCCARPSRPRCSTPPPPT